MNFNIDLFFQVYNLAYKNQILDALMIFGAEYLIFIVAFFVAASFFLGKAQNEAPRPYGRGIFSLLLRRERNPSEAENSSHSSSDLRLRYSAKGDKKATILSFLGLLIAFLLIKLIRVFYLEPRPFATFPITPLVNHEANAAFPSVHTTILATIAFAYTYYKSKWALFFLVSMLWTGFARIFIGVHYPLDILGGFTVGFISIALAVLALTFSQKLSKP